MGRGQVSQFLGSCPLLLPRLKGAGAKPSSRCPEAPQPQGCKELQAFLQSL
jgi:hypothetical protein